MAATRFALLLASLLLACSSSEGARSSLDGTDPGHGAGGDGGEDDAGTSSPTGGDAAADGGNVARPRLPEVSFPALDPTPGAGLAAGIVTGRIYDDLAKNTDARMRDFAALGVRILRLEIERATPMADYAKIALAAKANGIAVLALVTQNSLPAGSDPMAGTRADFDASFVPKVVAAIDALTAAIPSVTFVEVWNEPDVYAFQPFYAYDNGACIPKEGSFRYALMTVRVFETLAERRKKGMATPKMVAFDFSHQDDTCVMSSVANAQPIASHRSVYRAPNGLPDGLPTDIVSIHGYGLPNRIPGEAGYTYAGGTFADGVSAFLGQKFADGKSIIGAAPVWYTEVGFCLGGIGGADPLTRQSLAVTRAFDALRTHPQITAAFSYSYRDDEGTGGERCGLRDNSSASFAPHPAYASFQAASVAGGDHVGPGGVFELAAPAPAGGAFDAKAPIALRGWSIDASGAAPSIEIAIDGAVVTTTTDGTTPYAGACAAASSARCPNVGFAVTVNAPSGAGTHEIAARAKDAAGNARILGRIAVEIR